MNLTLTLIALLIITTSCTTQTPEEKNQICNDTCTGESWQRGEWDKGIICDCYNITQKEITEVIN